ncbi:MAG: hypothetical protein ACR2F6_13745 [Mycobacteriales bacterium]
MWQVGGDRNELRISTSPGAGSAGSTSASAKLPHSGPTVIRLASRISLP